MNQEQFVLLLTNQIKPDQSTLGYLQQIASDYPYCQPARILLAKNMQQHDKIAFEKQVNQASAYATDRRKFHLIISGRYPGVTTAKKPNEVKQPLNHPERVVVPAKPIVPIQTQKKPKSWLKRVKNVFGIEKTTVSDEQAVQSMVSTRHEVAPKATKAKVSAQQQIIERFLQEDPRIEFKKELFSDENLAVKSVVEHNDLATETLAQVLVKQGKTDKALAIYEKLSLKYPEKSSYFAKIMATLTNETT